MNPLMTKLNLTGKTIMKKNILFAAFAAMFFAAACQQEIEPVDQQGTPEQDVEVVPAEGLTFKAQFEESPVSGPANASTKTILGEDGKSVLWKVYDGINVFDGEGDPLTVEGFGSFLKGSRFVAGEGAVSEDGKTATFSIYNDQEKPITAGKEIYWAFCPYIADAAIDFENKKLNSWLMRYQKGNKGNFSEHRGVAGRYLNFAVGSTTDPENEPIIFKNVLCHLKFTIPADMAGKITRIGVHTGAGDYLSGDLCSDISGDAPVASLRYNYKESKQGSRYATMYLFPDHGAGNSPDATGETFEEGEYYMAVMPCELKSGLFVTFDTEDGTVCHRDHYAPSTVLLRNKVYDMGELTWNRPVAATGTGVTLPYAFSFLQAQSSNGEMTYSNKGSLTKGTTLTGYNGNTYTMASGTIASDKTSDAKLTAQTTVGLSSKNLNATPYLGYWHNSGGHDPIITGQILNRVSMAGLPFENYFKLSVPLSTDLPSTFNVSVGLSARKDGGWCLSDWKLFYSNDDKVWIEAPETFDLAEQKNKNGDVKNSVYPFGTFTVSNDLKFRSGGMLYLKFMPKGNKIQNGGNNDGSTGSIGHNTSGVFTIHSCIAIYDPAVKTSTIPSGAVFYEAFDSVNGGLDYFWGGNERKRLAAMANLCGDALTLSGYQTANCYSRPGYAQLGYLKTYGDGNVSGAAVGSLTTPALNVAGDVTLEFKAAAYRHPAADRGGSLDIQTPDNTSIQIEVIGGGTIDGQTTVVIENVNTEAWQTITKTITGATAATQIKFTSPSGSTYNRWFLDDILVK